jgi:hypothetical protein
MSKKTLHLAWTSNGPRERREHLMDAFHQLHTASVASACITLGINRAAIYRQRAPQRHSMPPKPRPACAFALNQTEREDILDILDSDRFVDVAPATIYTYTCFMIAIAFLSNASMSR